MSNTTTKHTMTEPEIDPNEFLPGSDLLALDVESLSIMLDETVGGRPTIGVRDAVDGKKWVMMVGCSCDTCQKFGKEVAPMESGNLIRAARYYFVNRMEWNIARGAKCTPRVLSVPGVKNKH